MTAVIDNIVTWPYFKGDVNCAPRLLIDCWAESRLCYGRCEVYCCSWQGTIVVSPLATAEEDNTTWAISTLIKVAMKLVDYWCY